MLTSPPRIIIAALRGGSGKTILSLGLTSAWRYRGYRIAPFKKGPDFIDAAWLSFASGRPCHNLDSFMMTDEQILGSYLLNSKDCDLTLIEGNRGLFDGLDPEGCCSTAELGKTLKCPVILIVDVTMATRTVAALIRGCQAFDRDLPISGVILNRVGGSRQEALIKASIDRYCGIPVVGAIPKLKGNPFPERHMGLVPRQERAHAEEAVAWARSTVETWLDLDILWRLAHEAPPLEKGADAHMEAHPIGTEENAPRIGFIRDRAFWFYYPENLDQLKSLGAILTEVHAMEDEDLPELDALYIGGGFPETQAEALANNRRFKESLRQRIEDNLPVYAECGGLLYLGESLLVEGRTYPMVGAFPVAFSMEKRPQGHGYTIMEVEKENPYYPVGEVIRGHEFHYSRPLTSQSREITSVFKMRRGHGLDGERDGLYKKNLLATYTHIHASGKPLWGENFFRSALRFKEHREGQIIRTREMKD